MLCILYVSELSDSPACVSDIIRQARAHNERDAVTGLLCFDGASFAQWLEGEDMQVTALYERIQCDRRHTNVTRLLEQPLSERRFPKFTMGYLQPTENEETLRALLGCGQMSPEQVAARFLEIARHTDAR